MFVHTLNPVLLSLGPLEIRWYGVIYAFGFVLAYLFLRRAKKRGLLELRTEQIDSLLLYLLVGVLLGARLFEILFYNFGYYVAHPGEIIALWHGGLSFHGGLVGAVLGVWFFCKKHTQSFLQLADVLVLPVALALGLGRIANFINGELYGRITSVPWGVKFPGVDGFRHPSQLYESLKNFFIFAVLLHLESKDHKPGFIFAWFLFLYGVLRFLVEYVREPEIVLGFLTMGQWLSVPLILLGLFMIRTR